MKIVLFADNTVPVNLPTLCSLLTRACGPILFTPGASAFHLQTPTVSSPATYATLSAPLIAETARHDLAVLFTGVPYENNYFFESHKRLVIVSFAGWHLLTRLPISNGIAYFVASILADTFGIGSSHHENTGCLNDFWWDKRGIDAGMRAAFVCPECASSFGGDPGLLTCVRRLLDLVSTASRLDRDILTLESSRTHAAGFDVFLCHNGDDKPAVRAINERLRAAGIRTWLDEEELPLGAPWQPELERQIANVRAACVFVGPGGLGPWQNAEIRGFLSEFVDRECPVIPVLLPGAPAVPQLPIFLRQMTWLDLRDGFDNGLMRLIEALRGQGARRTA